MMSTSSSLPTAPIGKQQVIDLKAGAILRENARKSGLFFGCPLGVVLILIVLCKCLFISFWIIREYETFDFRCSAWNGSPDTVYRSRRWALFESSDPRTFSKNPDDDDDSSQTVVREEKKKKPIYAASRRSTSDPTVESPKIDPSLDFGPLPPTFERKIESNDIPDEDEEDLPMTTMVTLTNTQIVPLRGEEQGVVKMKTIRNRVEKIGSDEEQFIEIDIANAPRIYVSKIKSRQGGEQEEEQFDLLKELKKDKKKKKKGKGLKKAKKMMELEQNSTTTVAPEVTTKKRKGGKKAKKVKGGEEVTKQPRHLVGKSSSQATTPRPHSSSWINGVLDPQDSLFSNQGHVRGYPMQTASRIPVQTSTMSNEQPLVTSSPQPVLVVATAEKSAETEHLKISESTRMMWDMDELKYTTFLAPKTTEQTKMEEKPVVVTTSTQPTTARKVMPNGMSVDEWEQKKEEFEAYTPKFSQSELDHPPHSRPSSFASEDPITSTHRPAPSQTLNYPHFAPSEAPYYVEVNEADTETIYVKDVTPMYRDILMERREETTTREYDPLHLEMEIAKLKESSICLARMAFDIWCLFMLFSSVPFIMGICVPRWSLFVLHIVFDFLFLVVGFVTSLTIAIMATIMYFLIEEMTSDSLFEFLIVAFVIDTILIIYSIIVGVAYRCCCRLVDNSIKDSNLNYSISSSGEPV